MGSVSIIGSGNMAGAIGTLAVKGGNTVEIIGRDRAKAQALASALDNSATVGTWGTAPAGDIVILAVLFDSAVPIVSEYGDALANKIVVDITNPFNASATGLAIPHDTSIAQKVAEAAPASAYIVKAFNTLFRDVLAAGGPLDVFIAGDDAQAKASVSAFIASLGLRPQDTGDLSMAHWLEGAGLLSVGLANHGVGSLNFSLGVNLR
ncbi:NADP oxidoreductase [Mycobacterium kubicae]|uniref:NADPH-dependent F420 reductase n=1 Tax=Mycobacterium kubicae TaxID=120959 RepID=UPI0007FCE469|nr:NAD(P)-binding domain-containing protein [Mycobacterium kubicae]OBF20162.1 NADP oxidoreductase [Mycobacterium kubicae]